MNIRSSLICFFGLALVCASVPGECQIEKITAEEVLAGAPFNLDKIQVELVPEEDVFVVSPEMKLFLDSSVDPSAGDSYRLHQLADAVINDGSFDLEYSATTRTASETFWERGGNCLSFTIMFVVMARYLDLDVEYQEVDVPAEWTRDGGVSILNRHINVFVDMGQKRYRVVDFNTDNLESDFKMVTISDDRALAHFNNNMGAERLLAGDTTSAFLYLRRAIANDNGGFSPAWTNLATLYLREGFSAHAEVGYLEALKADRSDFVAVSNLARIYQQMGDTERAAEYQKKVVYHRKRNPYYRYQLAERAFDAGDYDAAIDHLKYAVRKRRNEDEFHYLLGLSYLKMGDEKAAQRWFSKAEEAATSDALKKKYSNKLEHLQSSAE